MSLLKYIMSPFVEFKEDTKSPQLTKESVQTNNAEKPPSSTGYQSTPDVPEDKAGLSSTPPLQSLTSSGEYQKHFEDLIEDANAKNPVFQGTDFKEFIDSKIDVEAIADEGTRYRTAFNVLKRTGLTKSRLVSTGKEYLNIIDQDLNGFNDAFVQQYKTEVEQKELLLQKKAEELQALNQKISALNTDITQMSLQITQSKDKLTARKNSFIAAGENKKKEIRVELQKINQYFSD